jgi:hypothetical protein
MGNVCVAVTVGGSFSVKKNDEIVIDGQVRTAAGDQFLANDGNYSRGCLAVAPLWSRHPERSEGCPHLSPVPTEK